MKVLVTCPPMLGMMDEFKPIFSNSNVDVYCPDVIQTLSENELIELVSQFDGWIIGDDPATEAVFRAGKNGKLKAAVKWGIGVDNVDLEAAKQIGITIINTPNMFGGEVADIAMSYVTALARETFYIDRQVRQGKWPKPRGISLQEKVLGLVGFGDIGKNVAKRALAADMSVIAYDPVFEVVSEMALIQSEQWPNRIEECDFIVFTCSLNVKNRHMLNSEVLAQSKHGVRIVNVARGPLIDELALIVAIETGQVHSVALDVFEDEPLSISSALHHFERNIFGSHNASNTADAVNKTSIRAIEILFDFLNITVK